MKEKLKIAFLGDVMPGGLMWYEGSIDPKIIEYLDTFDLRVATCETAFGDGTKLCCFKMGDPKVGTVIYSPDESVKLFKQLKIDIVSIANNHIGDCDLDGIYHSIDILKENGIKCVGAGRNIQEASSPLTLVIKGYKISFLAYFKDYKWMYNKPVYNPNEKEGGINKYSLQKVIQDVKHIKYSSDFVFVMPHWGKEHTQCPNIDEYIEARRIIRTGATAVIGSHTHTVQPIWKYKNGIIAMSLGNFVFPDRYIDKPRKTVYPSIDVLKEQIPETYGFPFVECVTLKKVKELDRIGCICGIRIFDNSISYEQIFTRLDEKHHLSFNTNLSQDYFIKMNSIKKKYNVSLLMKFMLKSCYSRLMKKLHL